MADEPRTFRTDTPQANRNLQQGGGSGQSEMEAQGNPTRETDATRSGDRTDALSDEEGAQLRGGEGTPPNIGDDLEELDEGETDGPPSYGAQQGRTHTTWPEKTEAERGQGPKTMARNKEINSGKL